MAKISAIIITFNEENNIQDCLKSLDWADEIIIVDSRSTDKTVEIASKFTKQIFFTENLPYFAKKNIAIEKASCEWVLSVDADERVTDELKNEIQKEINASGNLFEAYTVNRKSFFISKFINHCGWYPDYVTRLFKKSSGAKFSENLVHEKLVLKGRIGKIESDLLHYTNRNFEHYLKKLNIYTTYSAHELYAAGKKARIVDIIFRPAFTFIKMYFLKLGILDGFIGFVLCFLSSIHVFVKYSKLYILEKKII
jgi:glycosyltransferase involved in cell wall biosynthesis